jgi:hypothetical protein
MGYKQERVDIISRFFDLWPDLFPVETDTQELPVEDKEQTHGKIFILNGTANQTSMGDTKNFRHVGVITIQLFFPIREIHNGEDKNSPEFVADIVGNIFRAKSFGQGIITRATEVQKIGKSMGFYQYNINTPFIRDELI